MARRQRQLVPQLWQRELGVRRARADAPAHRQHQRSPDRGERAQVSLAARPPSRRTPVLERTRTLGGILATVATAVRRSRTTRALRWRSFPLPGVDSGAATYLEVGGDRKRRLFSGCFRRDAR